MPTSKMTLHSLLILVASSCIGVAVVNGQRQISRETITSENASQVQEVILISEGDAEITDGAISSDSSFIAFTSTETLTIWDINLQTSRWRIPVDAGGPVALSPNDELLAACVNYAPYLWEVQDSNQWTILPSPNQNQLIGLSDVGFTVDGSEVIGGLVRSGGLIRWSTNTLEILDARSFEFGEATTAHYSILSSDGQFNVITRQPYTVEFRETANGNLLWSLAIDDLLNLDPAQHYFTLIPITISPDSATTLVSVDFLDTSEPNRLIWLDADGNLILQVEHDYGRLSAGTFSPDGQLIALGNRNNGEIYLLSAETGEELTVLTRHSEWVTSLSFNTEGTLLMSTSTDGTVRLWGIPSE